MEVTVNAVAGALKAFFADLPDPLIPYSLHPELLEAASKYKPFLPPFSFFLFFPPSLPSLPSLPFLPSLSSLRGMMGVVY